MDRLLALPDVLDATGVSRSTIYAWVAEGRFRAPWRPGPEPPAGDRAKSKAGSHRGRRRPELVRRAGYDFDSLPEYVKTDLIGDSLIGGIDDAEAVRRINELLWQMAPDAALDRRDEGLDAPQWWASADRFDSPTSERPVALAHDNGARMSITLSHASAKLGAVLLRRSAAGRLHRGRVCGARRPSGALRRETCMGSRPARGRARAAHGAPPDPLL